MKQEDLALVFDKAIHEIHELRTAGQKEYPGEGNDAFDNFDRIAKELQTTKEKVLWVYAMKHKDGIARYLNGHRSQRESVIGRISDLIVYLLILRGMIEENNEDEL